MGYTAPGFEPTIVLKKGELVEVDFKSENILFFGIL